MKKADAVLYEAKNTGRNRIENHICEEEYMDVYEAIRTRKSVRSFLDKPVEDAKLGRIFEAARLAPSARNDQEWRFVIVREEELRKKLAEAASNQHFIAEAPVVIACCAAPVGRVMRCGFEPYPIDVAIIMDHISLLAVSEGLGTCWIGSFDQEAVKKILRIPLDIKVVELMPLGYPKNPNAVAKERLKLDTLIHYETW